MLRNKQTVQTTSTLKRLFIGLICTLLLVLAGCGTPPKRPAYTGADTVGAVSRDAFIGSWQYTVLNPMVEEERNVKAKYQFNADGTFVANSETNAEMKMQMESVGTWAVSDDLFVLSIDDVKETSGNQIAALAVQFTKAMLKKQTGEMNPYTISPDRIVMLSMEHGSAIQLDRL